MSTVISNNDCERTVFPESKQKKIRTYETRVRLVYDNDDDDEKCKCDHRVSSTD